MLERSFSLGAVPLGCVTEHLACAPSLDAADAAATHCVC